MIFQKRLKSRCLQLIKKKKYHNFSSISNFDLSSKQEKERQKGKDTWLKYIFY